MIGSPPPNPVSAPFAPTTWHGTMIDVRRLFHDALEVDEMWTKLTAGGGQPGPCGWLKDKYGLSWQVVPTVLNELLEDPKKSERVMAAMLNMSKLDIETLEAAAEWG